MEPIHKRIEVPCDQEQAFEVFLDIESWWPTDRFATSVMSGHGVQTIRVDARNGGGIVEVGTDGSEYVWGTITEYDPNDYLRMDFHVPHPSQERPGFTVVEVRFTPVGDGRTAVELTQSGWEGLGDMAEMASGGYRSAWTPIFEQAYAEACAAGR